MAIDVSEEFKKQVIQLIASHGVDRDLIRLTRPPRQEFGDLSSAVAFELASRTGENPRKIAHKIVETLDLRGFDLVDRAVVAGSGYINFYINHKVFGPRTLVAIQQAGDRYGDSGIQAQGKIIIEHTSVNPNKPWHIGHSRNAILGDALGRLYRKAGYEVEVQNYIDDTGRQVAETIFAVR